MKVITLFTSILICLSFTALSIGKAEIIRIILKHPGIKYKDITIAQFILETGNNKSKLAKHNNIFGIKYNRKFANGKIGSYATYKSIHDCISHYIFIQNYFSKKYNVLNKKDYLWFLKKKYATSTSYTKRVVKIASKYKIDITNVSSHTL
jgi:flagellum-specific peptidoglycan hydrolase FlgJ